jgi:hypothetical protein
VRALCERVGERVWWLLDEAFADFLEPGEDAATARRRAAEPARLPHVRQGARDGGLPHRLRARADRRAGRAAHALVLRQRAAQAAAAWALELGDPVLARRRAAATRERERLTHALHGTSLSFPPTPPPFVWLSSETHDGAAIAQAPRRPPILVAARDRWGDERHVRITLRDADATDRLIAALRELGLTVARTYDEIDDHLRAWIARQPMFFVGSAPLAGTATSTSRRRARAARCACSARAASPTSTTSGAAPRRSPTCARTAASS